GLADTGTAEQTHFAALGERAQQIDDLDTGLQQLLSTGLILVTGRCAVNGPVLFGVDRAALVLRFAQHVHDAAQRGLADRHRNRVAGILRCRAAGQAIGHAHGDATHDAVTDLLLDLEHQIMLLDDQCVMNLRQAVTIEFDVYHRTDDLYDFTATHILDPLKTGTP